MTLMFLASFLIHNFYFDLCFIDIVKLNGTIKHIERNDVIKYIVVAIQSPRFIFYIKIYCKENPIKFLL